MQLENRVTGDRVEVNSLKQRVTRMRRRVSMWANLLKPYLEDRRHFRLVMVTLTYRDKTAWSPYDISKFVLKLKGVLGDGLLAYAWVGEMQARGAVHYHVMLVTMAGVRIPYPDEGLWIYGMSRIETARTPFYIVKYVGKDHQRENFPKGMRIFALYVRRGVLTDNEKWELMVTALPVWLAEKMRTLYGTGTWVKRLPGGGWRVGKGGVEGDYDELESDWVVLAVDGDSNDRE